MRFNILSDSEHVSGVHAALSDISNLGYRDYFQQRNYGEDLTAITIVLICQPSELNLKARQKFSKKERKLYFDIALDLQAMSAFTHAQRYNAIITSVKHALPEVLAKYKFRNFHASEFLSDINTCFGLTPHFV